MNIIEQAAKVLAEIDEQLALAEKATAGPWKPHIPIQGRCNAMPEDFAFIAASRTGWPTTLRCLKTAIEGLLEIYKYDSGNGCCDYGCDTPTIAENLLTTLITQWNENK